MLGIIERYVAPDPLAVFRRVAVFEQLLALPDPSDLKPRRSWQVYDTPIFGDLLKADLARAYVQWRMEQERGEQ